MSHTVPFKLNKPASEFQAGDSIGFGIRGGVKYRDPQTKEEAWTNYEAVIFAKSDAQIKYYRETLVEGSVVVVTCSNLQVRTFDGNNGPLHNLRMINANLEYIATAGERPQQNHQQSNQAPQQRQNQQVQQQPANQFNWPDDEIGF